jgi:phosphoglycolate phosphatase
MKQKVILFDLDGTLIDSTEAILESFARAFETMGAAVPDAAKITPLIGHPLDVMFVELGVEDTRKWDFVDAYKRHYRRISKEKTVLLPGAHEAISSAAKFARLGIVTTKTALYSREMLEHMGVMHYFEVLIGREDVTHPKPHPEPVLKAVRKLKCDTTMCWLIGDTPMDILAADAAGIKSVAVTSGYADKDLLREHTSFVEKDALDAVKFISAS